MATEAQWRQLVRRAVGVPDLIGDQVALAMVTDVVFSSELQSQPRSDDDDVIAEAVWAAVVKLGAAEELDAFLMESSSRYGLLDWDWLYDRVVTDARSRSTTWSPMQGTPSACRGCPTACLAGSPSRSWIASVTSSRRIRFRTTPDAISDS